ncbi:putative 4-mercaptohistidine N1-methyltransferase, partial [Hydrogenimonas sp.]
LPFFGGGGYKGRRGWSEGGGGWRSEKESPHPHFWRRGEDGWRYRALTREIPLPLDWPVDVNFHEAEAFCRWLSHKEGREFRLPTEAEWMRMRRVCGLPDAPEWGEKPPADIGLAHWASSCGVATFAHGPLYDVVGNVWQWTRTPIHPYEGFAVHPIYDDFTTPTFDNRHNLIKGGSWASTGNETLRSARYAFRRHFFQHAGFRYVHSEAEPPAPGAACLYESDEQVSQYCEFGWGGRYFDVPNYPAACAEICLALTQGTPRRRALDVGCAIGRSTLELARGFERVTGLDFSARFIAMAETMRREGRIRYTIPVEGELVEYKEAVLPESLARVADRVDFWQADACNLKPHFRGYDLVFAGNLIDRLYDPAAFLRDIAGRIEPGGWLVLTSPYTWLEAFTPKEKWLGGFKRDGEPVTSLQGIQEVLGADFELAEVRDVPFVIRETARKFQHSVAQLSAWRKKG